MGSINNSYLLYSGCEYISNTVRTCIISVLTITHEHVMD